VHSLAKYALELTLTDYKLAHCAPSIVAAASLAFAMRVLAHGQESLKTLWTPTLAHYSAYSLDQIKPVVAQVADIVRKATAGVDGHGAAVDEGGKKPWKQLESVAKKYKDKKFLKVSLIPQLRQPLLTAMAAGKNM